eukprot:14621707-Alexandrium_andersonii.AAC.1
MGHWRAQGPGWAPVGPGAALLGSPRPKGCPTPRGASLRGRCPPPLAGRSPPPPAQRRASSGAPQEAGGRSPPRSLRRRGCEGPHQCVQSLG